jgi:FKBP-type peptidyl-prolyl cis-trans isomerase (trigger factor)
MSRKTTKESKQKSNTTTVAKSSDGTVQITFTIPYKTIEEQREKAALELGKDIVVPGFRKGNAPLNKLIEHIPDNTLLEKTLSGILPKLVGEAVDKNDLKPVIYPRFELIKANEGEDWEVRATTAEIPEFSLGDYEKTIKENARSKTIWTPGKGEKQAPTREEKEQEVINTLVEKIDVTLPKILIDDEVNSRLSKLLERLEKLGLTLENYLASISKTAETIRSEYQEQAKTALSLDLILSKIAEKENITVSSDELDQAINVGTADPKLAQELNSPERRKMVEEILKKRKTLEKMTSLI